VALLGSVIVIGHFLRQLNLTFSPVLWASADIIAALLGFAIAANILVRYQGTGDRFSLFLGLGFAFAGFVQLTGIVGLHSELLKQASTHHVPVYWMMGGTLLGALVLIALLLDEWLPWPRASNMTLVAVSSIVGAITLVTVLAFLLLRDGPVIRNSPAISRPWDLIPAAMFLAAAILLYRSPYRLRSTIGISLPWVMGMNAACHLMATQSAQLFDTPGITAQLLNSAGYMILLGATLVDNVRLFEHVRYRAISDSLTGLANYSRLLESARSDLERSRRNHSPFSILLIDVDKLKEINDRYGHLTGTQAICRVAAVIRQHCGSAIY